MPASVAFVTTPTPRTSFSRPTHNSKSAGGYLGPLRLPGKPRRSRRTGLHTAGDTEDIPFVLKFSKNERGTGPVTAVVGYPNDSSGSPGATRVGGRGEGLSTSLSPLTTSRARNHERTEWKGTTGGVDGREGNIIWIEAFSRIDTTRTRTVPFRITASTKVRARRWSP